MVTSSPCTYRAQCNLASLRTHLTRQSKVDDLHLTLAVAAYVRWCQIAVNNVVLVAVLDATDDLLEKATRFIFRKLFVHPNERGYSSLPNDIVEQLSSGNIFHYQKDVGWCVDHLKSNV